VSVGRRNPGLLHAALRFVARARAFEEQRRRVQTDADLAAERRTGPEREAPRDLAEQAAEEELDLRAERADELVARDVAFVEESPAELPRDPFRGDFLEDDPVDRALRDEEVAEALTERRARRFRVHDVSLAELDE